MTMGFRGKVDAFLRKPYAMAYIFIFPTFFLLIVFHILPFLGSFIIALLDMQVSFKTAKFVGLRHYFQAVNDRFFINSMKVTLKFVFFEIPWQMAVGLIFSALVTKNTIFNKLMRSIYFLPIVVSATALGIMWGFILNSNIGLVPYWLDMLGFGKLNFLANPDNALKTVIFVVVWRTFGISTLMLVAAMQAVPDDYYDASEIDGAGKIRQFWSITLPSIMPTIWFLLMTRIIGALQIFDIVYTLTGGGPNYTTETLVSYVFRKSGDGTSNMGYATAMSHFLFGFILVITTVQYIIMTKTED